MDNHAIPRVDNTEQQNSSEDQDRSKNYWGEWDEEEVPTPCDDPQQLDQLVSTSSCSGTSSASHLISATQPVMDQGALC